MSPDVPLWRQVSVTNLRNDHVTGVEDGELET